MQANQYHENRDNMNNYKASHGQDDNPHEVVNIKSQQNLNDYKKK